MSLTKVSGSMIQGWQVTPEEFGAIGNGVADDSAAMQAACDYCSQTGATLWMSPKVYYKARLELHGTYTIHGNGATVMYLGVGQTIVGGSGTGTLAVPTPWLNDPSWSPSYPPTTMYTLSVAPALSSTTLTLTSVTGITVGMYLFICGNPSSMSSDNNGPNFIPRDFEFVRVVGIAGNVITLAAPLQSAYLTTQSGVFYAPGLAINCHVSDININTTVDAYQQVVRSSYNCTINNVLFSGINAPGASTFSEGLVYNNLVFDGTNGGNLSTARGTVSTTFNNVSMRNYNVLTSFFIEESFYDVTLNNYVATGALALGSMDCTNTQRKRKFTVNNSVFNPGAYGGVGSSFTGGAFIGADVVCNNTRFQGGVTTPNPGLYPSITGDALVWLSSNQSGDLVTFENCQFISANAGPTWPVALGAFNGTVRFDPLCTYVTCSAPSQIVPFNETGTWTPVMTGTTTAGTTTHTVQTGNYIRVGNLVTVNFTVTWSAATGTGNMLVYGLPFTVGALNIGNTFIADGTLAIATGAAALPQSSQVRILVTKAISGTGNLNGIVSYIV